MAEVEGGGTGLPDFRYRRSAVFPIFSLEYLDSEGKLWRIRFNRDIIGKMRITEDEWVQVTDK